MSWMKYHFMSNFQLTILINWWEFSRGDCKYEILDSIESKERKVSTAKQKHRQTVKAVMKRKDLYQ